MSSPYIQECVGDIFDSPPTSILLHACNTRGSWGAGVALAFKRYSPQAYSIHRAHCLNSSSASTSVSAHQQDLVGTCQLIPPFPFSSNPSPHQKPPKTTSQQEEKRFWIGCLFTSSGYGRQKDSADQILSATRKAIEDLKRQIDGMKEIGEVYTVRINSGLFGVEWDRTKEVLEESGVRMTVVRPEEAEGEKEKRGTKRKTSGETERTGVVNGKNTRIEKYFKGKKD